MVPIVSLIGRPNCGKTTLIEKLIPALIARGISVGTIKHHVHGAFAMDIPGKDSYRHKQAGARTVVLSSPTGVGMITDCRQDTPLAELLCRYFSGIDLVIAEGYKQGDSPKIEVFRKDLYSAPLPDPGDGSRLAWVTDHDFGDALPRFSPHDPDGLADFLVSRFLPAPPGRGPSGSPRVSMVVDGDVVPLADSDQGLLLKMAARLSGADLGTGEILLAVRCGKNDAAQ